MFFERCNSMAQGRRADAGEVVRGQLFSRDRAGTTRRSAAGRRSGRIPGVVLPAQGRAAHRAI